MISIPPEDIKTFQRLKDEVKSLPRKIKETIEKDGEKAVKGTSAQSALRMALGMSTVKSLDEITTKSLSE